MAMPTEENVNAEDIPTELQGRLSNFDDALSKIEEILEPVHSVPLSEIHAKINSLDKAKLDLISVYAINSLFWMYLNVKGENPKDHHVKTELDRIRVYMNRVKEIQEKQNAPKIDKAASKRFVRSALWQMAHKKAKESTPAASKDQIESSAHQPESSARSSSSQPQNPEVITISSSQSQNSDSETEESPAKKEKTGKKKRNRHKKKNHPVS